jgi:hypothetical protein
MKIHDTNSATNISVDSSYTDEDTVWAKSKTQSIFQNKGDKLRKNAANSKFLIYPDDMGYKYWTIVITCIMLYTATVVPYRIALVENEDLSWFIADLFVDFLFFVDVIIN